MALPGIGRGIAMAIMEMLSTGRWSQLERLRGSLQPEQLFQTLPGIGPELAARIHGTSIRWKRSSSLPMMVGWPGGH
jgi:DNA uptake protein ComE-like DNA-binding protein